jgi:hypothetical protein
LLIERSEISPLSPGLLIERSEISPLSPGVLLERSEISTLSHGLLIERSEISPLSPDPFPFGQDANGIKRAPGIELGALIMPAAL